MKIAALLLLLFAFALLLGCAGQKGTGAGTSAVKGTSASLEEADMTAPEEPGLDVSDVSADEMETP